MRKRRFISGKGRGGYQQAGWCSSGIESFYLCEKTNVTKTIWYATGRIRISKWLILPDMNFVCKNMANRGIRRLLYFERTLLGGGSIYDR